MPTKIQSIDELRERLIPLFQVPGAMMNATGAHQLVFFVGGTPKSVQALLAPATQAALWSNHDGVMWTYKNEDEDFLLALSKAGRGQVLVCASIISLHEAYLSEFQADSANET